VDPFTLTCPTIRKQNVNLMFVLCPGTFRRCADRSLHTPAFSYSASYACRTQNKDWTFLTVLPYIYIYMYMFTFRHENTSPTLSSVSLVINYYVARLPPGDIRLARCYCPRGLGLPLAKPQRESRAHRNRSDRKPKVAYDLGQ